MILMRDYMAKIASTEDLKKIYEKKFLLKDEENFDAKLLKPELFYKPKVEYLVEVLKHTSHIGKKVVFVVENHLVDFITEVWRNSSMDLKSF